MKQWAYFILLSLITIICVCFIAVNIKSVRRVTSATIELDHYKKMLGDLEVQIKRATSERDTANEMISRLEAEVSSLLEQRKADYRIIENLRESLRQSETARLMQDAEEQAVVERKQHPDVEDVDEKSVKYDAELVRQMISSAGNLQDAIRRIITSEGIGSTLQEHNEDPAHWVAAASLAPELQAALMYLEQAAALYPESSMVMSSLIDAQIAHDHIDGSTVTYIDQIKKADPTNALADCYAAYYQFSNEDVEAALQSLSQASIKDRFADDSIDLLMARKDYFLNEGCSDSVALGLSAFDLPLSHTGMLRQIGEYSMAQAEALYEARQYDDALRIATEVSKLGGTLSSSGRFIVSDRVGIELQLSALGRQKQIYEALGDVAEVAEIDSQLQVIQERSDTIDIMVQALASVMQNMTDQSLADYVNGTILNGEFSTLRNFPEIVEALEEAHKQRQEEVLETSVP